ncbi:transgelin-3-like isoform X4 [Pecten maximus]|uniref:transgelin-3-like isoform X4 n=1 Tax=Pecten maximus TaxID=6579 RepID=UPI00145838D6|nr:transgelin-3-like isoform X4 [Pecten maximus]
MSDRMKPMGMDRALTSKLGAKYDSASEAEVRIWIQELTGEDIGQGPAAVEKNLKNGIVLTKLLQKLYAGTANLPPAAQNFKPSYNESELAFKQMENIEKFLKGAKCYGLKDNSLFQTVDLYEGRNMAMVIATILQVGTEAQRHGFDGPMAGTQPHDKPEKRNFTYEQLKASCGIIPIEAGSNKFASQKGMKMGAVRHVADIRCDVYDKESLTMQNQQVGTNHYASQKGMTAMGAVRHISDIRADDACDEGKGTINLQCGTNRWASQKGMTAMGAIRHIRDIVADDLSLEGAAVIRGDMGYTDGASQAGMTAIGSIRHVSDIHVDDLAEDMKKAM